MLSAALTWIVARFRRTGTALVAGFLIAWAVIAALAGIKRKSKRKGRWEQKAEDARVQLEQALKDGEKHAKITDAMHEANTDGPHSADDVLDRMRNAKDD